MPPATPHHLIAPRPLNPAALATFWVSVLFLPGLLLIGILQHLVDDHETQLRHEFRGRLIREVPLFVRDLRPESYIERYQKKLFPLLDRQNSPDTFVSAWKAATGFAPVRMFHAGPDLAAVTIRPSPDRDPANRPPPARVIAAWLQDLAGMGHRRRLAGDQPGRGGILPSKTTSKLLIEYFGLPFPPEFIADAPMALFSTKHHGEILYFTLHLDADSHAPDAAIRSGCLLVFRDRDISRGRALRDACRLGRSRGLLRMTRWRPRRYTSLVDS
ncbi:MAG TPA: hypothetical protein PLP29_14890 [Candidatus Ozemobacteraceae bacterium]|nr:hypothetical protein [Candidatus Ozemobacteraceae bacterium]